MSPSLPGRGPWDWTRGEDPPLSYLIWWFFFSHHVSTPTSLSGPPLSSDGVPHSPTHWQGPLTPIIPTIALRLSGFPLRIDQANLQGKPSPAPRPTVVPTLPAPGLNVPFSAWKGTLGLDSRRPTYVRLNSFIWAFIKTSLSRLSAKKLTNKN
jgi:hypothetical protein